VALAFAGCRGDDDSSVTADADKTTTSRAAPLRPADLERFVVRKSDLPDGYEEERRVSSSSPGRCLGLGDTPAAQRAIETRFVALGFQACAAASFRKRSPGTVDKDNPAAASAVMLRDEDAASDALPELRRAVIGSLKVGGAASGFEPHSTPAPGLGDEAPRGATFTGDYSPLVRDVTFHLYAWRRGNVVVLVTTTDALGDFDREGALELARTLDARGAG